MKKLLVASILGLSAVASTSYGQGLIHFANYFSSSSPLITYASANVPAGKANLAVGSSFQAQLGYFIGSTADPLQLTWLTFVNGGNSSPVVFGLGNTVNDGDAGLGAGWFDGGSVSIPGINAGNAGNITFAVRVFNGGSWAAGTVEGQSSLFTGGAQATSSSPVPDLPQGGWQNFTVTNVAAVPEPSMFALAGLGSAALLIFRRRK